MASSGTIRRKRVPAWVSNVAYAAGTIVNVDGFDYEAIQDHLSSAKNKPGTPGGEEAWLRRTGDPGRSYGLPAPWAANVLYAERAMVIYKRSVYVARSQHTSSPMNAPGVPGAPWTLFAAGGQDGAPGKDAVVEVDVLKQLVNEAVDKIPKPKDGEPGQPGRDGVSVKGDPGRPGEPGLPGRDGAGFRWMGYWKPNVEYRPRDVVRVNTDAGGARGGTFLCTKPIRGVKPPGPGWELFTQDGASGPAGRGTGTGNNPVSPTSLDVIRVAAVPLSGHRIVAENNDGTIRYPNITDITDADRILGMSLSAAGIGDIISVRLFGILTDSYFASFAQGLPVFLGAGGQITQTVPDVPNFYLRVGKVMSSNSFILDIDTEIVL